MSGKEFSKLVSAVLVAGASAMLCGFVAKQVVHADMPRENAFKIEVADTAAAPAAAPAAAAPAAAPAADAAAAPAAAPAASVLAMIGTADVKKGETAAKICATCHTFKKGEPARVGPNLWGIIGSKHAHMEGFKYSDAMAAKKDAVWDYEALDKYIENPKGAVPGNKMAYAGMKKPEDRAAVIAYLRSLADTPAPLPEAK